LQEAKTKKQKLSKQVSGKLNSLTTELNSDVVTQQRIFTDEWFIVRGYNQPTNLHHEDAITLYTVTGNEYSKVCSYKN
jgi:hypothetical protein